MRASVFFLTFLLAAIVVLSGCGLFRFTGYYSHSDTFPQLHYDWAKDPYFPSPEGTETHFDLRFPKTAKEHREAARTYLQKAKAYRTEAAIHRDMKSSYAASDGAMALQCDQTVRRFEEMAADMERLAKWHQEQAAKRKK